MYGLLIFVIILTILLSLIRAFFQNSLTLISHKGHWDYPRIEQKAYRYDALFSQQQPKILLKEIFHTTLKRW